MSSVQLMSRGVQGLLDVVRESVSNGVAVVAAEQQLVLLKASFAWGEAVRVHEYQLNVEAGLHTPGVKQMCLSPVESDVYRNDRDFWFLRHGYLLAAGRQ